MLSADCVDVSFTSGDWTDVTVTLVVLPDVTDNSLFDIVLPDTETEGLVAAVFLCVGTDFSASLGFTVFIVVSTTDIGFVMVPSVDAPIDCGLVKDTLVVSGSLDDGPVVGDDSVASAVRSVMRVDTPVAPVPVTVSLLVCSP